MPNKRWTPPAWLLAVDSHIAWGFGVPAWFAWWDGNFVFGAVVIIVISFFKEMFFDPYVEGAPFITSGIFDWLEYFLGVGLSAAVAYGLAVAFHLPLHWI